jgi:hypothetical protein
VGGPVAAHQHPKLEGDTIMTFKEEVDNLYFALQGLTPPASTRAELWREYVQRRAELWRTFYGMVSSHYRQTTNLGEDPGYPEWAVYAVLAGSIAADERASEWSRDDETSPVGDVGRCPTCGQQSRSYAAGCSRCGHGQVEAVPS